MLQTKDHKKQKLEYIARLYYEQNKTQEEIAAAMNISRPLVSRYLAEARKVGIVEFRIHSADQSANLLLTKLRKQFGLKSGILVPDAEDDHTLNRNLALGTIRCIKQKGGGRVGIGWGHFIGTLVEVIEEGVAEDSLITDICPLLGNSGILIRNYHSNENVRIIAQHAAATPHYLHVPAFVETQQDLDLLKQTEFYKAVYKEWENLDIVIVNIGNHPSTPDFATVARYGDLLVKHKAVGRLIAYYFNEDGEIIKSDSDYAIQIPISLLKKCTNVIGVCSANVGWRSFLGALRTGLFTDFIVKEKLAEEILKII